MHELPILTDVALALVFALLGGAIVKRMGLTPIVGYLLAGVAIGPFTPGFTGDARAIQDLAELGVLFLMFGVGLHFSFGDLWQVRTIAIPGAIIQIALSTAIGYGITQLWGWTPAASLVLGVSISVASTVVLLRALMDHGLLDTLHGRVAVGWLVFEDLATVGLLVLLPIMTSRGASGGWSIAAIAIGKAALFLALMLVGGKRLVPWLLRRIVFLQSRELFILFALAIALGTALLSAEWFGVSLALGAFVGGVVVSESPYSHQVGADLLSFREAFAVLFFVSVGMLVNPGYLTAHWAEVLILSAVIVIGKALIAAAIGFVFPYPARTGLVVAAGLSQIGEFSFIVGQTGVTLGLLDSAQYSLILAGALVSISVNPFVFRLVGPSERWLAAHPALWRRIDRHGPVPTATHALRDHVVIIGWGRVGRHLADVLGTLDVPRLVIESDSSLFEQLTRAHVPALFGDAANSEILSHASLLAAKALVVTVPHEAVAAIVVAAARARTPELHVIARAATKEGARHLTAVGANEVVRPELEGGLQMLQRALDTLGYPARRIQEYTDLIRLDEAGSAPQSARERALARLVATDLDLEWITLPPATHVAGLSVVSSRLRPISGASIVAIARGSELVSNPGADLVLHEGDEIAVIGTSEQIERARALVESTNAAT